MLLRFEYQLSLVLNDILLIQNVSRSFATIISQYKIISEIYTIFKLQLKLRVNLIHDDINFIISFLDIK